MGRLEEEFAAFAERGNRERKAAKDANHCCPICGGPGLLPLGGPGSYWFEHTCGAYSRLCATLEEALNPEGWQVVDAELNAAMYPPVGG